MKVFFIRNTHDNLGEYREVFRKLYELIDNQINSCCGLEVHGFNRSGERTTLDEYISSHYQYAHDYPEYVVPPIDVLLQELIYLIKIGLIRVEIE
jgi:hypothetical protein